jgi:hypothetical protein
MTPHRKERTKRNHEAPAEPRPPRRRRALTHVGGAVEIRGGEQGLSNALEAALSVGRDEAATRAHVHGFHSYPARLHPGTARALVERLSAPGETVLDPFMGSGTVLVEARLLGRRALGADLNPLAVELAHLKTRGTSVEERLALTEGAERAVDHAEERRIAKAGPTKKYGREDRELFDVHMLLELDGLSAGIAEQPPGFVQNALRLVLSSILVKVSRQPGDTAERVGPRRLASGFAIRLFEEKTKELVDRLAHFSALLPPSAPRCFVEVDDARKLSTVRSGTVDLVVSSPPYPGVYDYARHHEVRLRWLGLDARAFERGEIGARRHFGARGRGDAERGESGARRPFGTKSGDDPLHEWARAFAASLGAIRRVLRDDGAAVLVLADSVVQGRALYADDVLPDLADEAGLVVLATASQKRPHFHRPTRDAFAKRARREHAFVLTKG